MSATVDADVPALVASVLKVFLSRWTDTGAISIASTPDGRYHLLWRDRSIAEAQSIRDIMLAASYGPLQDPISGAPIRPFGLVRRWSDWFVTAAPLEGPVRD